MFFFANTGNNSPPGETQQKGDSPDPFAEVNSPEFLERLLVGGSESQRGFSRLVRLTHDRFLAFARRSLPSMEECREVVQEMYLAVHKGLAGFERKSRLTTWMYSLCRNKILDRVADRDRGHQELTEAVEPSTESTEPWESVTAWDAPPDRVLAQVSVQAWIAEAVEALPRQAREVYQLRDVEGLSGDEAALILMLSSGNIRVQLHRARRLIVDFVRGKMNQGSGQGTIQP